MPTILHYLDEPLRLRVSSRRQRPSERGRFICLLLGFCLGWILHSVLS